MARGVKSSDLLTLATVSDVQVAPDGRSAIWVVTDIVSSGNGAKGGADATPPRYRSRLHLSRNLAKQGGDSFTRGEYADTKPRYSPSGDRVAFLRVAEAGGRPQLYVMPLDGGEPKRVTEHKAGVMSFAWAGGDQLAYVTLDDYEDLGAKNGLPRRITKRYWRADGAGVLPTTPAQVHVVDLGSGATRKLTDLPGSPTLIAVAPDGLTLWALVMAGERPRGDFTTDLVTVDLKTGAHAVRLPELIGVSTLVPSPDGKWLAYTASQVQDDVASESGVWVLDLGEKRGQPRLISGERVTPPSAGGDSRYGTYSSAPAWSPDSRSLLINLNAEGASGLARIDLTGDVEVLQPERRVVTGFTVPRDNSELEALFTAEYPDRPGEVYARWRGGRESQVSRVNNAWSRRLTLVAPEGPFAAGAADAPYWLLRPAKARADGAAVVQVHGGPHTNYGYGFNLEFQLLAAKGYAVIFGNPRGSSSYGFSFATSFLGNYGSVDADDVMAFAEAGHARLGRKDAPLHLTGGSYGGFMTNWLVGQTTRFRSAVTQRSICNWTSMYGTSDIGPWFVEREIGGVPWGDAEALWRQSPIRFADKITTPLLIVHSEEDYRCPIEQGEQLFSVLKRLGKAETEFFRVPGEGHELSRSGRPDRRVQRLDAIVDWFERHA